MYDKAITIAKNTGNRLGEGKTNLNMGKLLRSYISSEYAMTNGQKLDGDDVFMRKKRDF